MLVFIPIPKKGNAKECSNYCTIALISHASKSENKNEICSVVSDSLQPHGLYSPWNSPGHSTGMCNHYLLQGIFPTQGSNPGLPHCRQNLYQLNQQGISNASKVTFKIVQAMFQQYVNWTLPDVPTGFRKGRGTRDQIPNIHCIIEKARKFQKYYLKNLWLCGSTQTVGNSYRDGNTRPHYLPLEKPLYRSRSNN